MIALGTEEAPATAECRSVDHQVLDKTRLRERTRFSGDVLLPMAVVVFGIGLWHGWVCVSGHESFPTPVQVGQRLVGLAEDGLLLKHTMASLYRVTLGFGLAALVGILLGSVLGWSRRAEKAFNPLIQALRPISPIAWIPLALLWFGFSDAAPIFLIFLATVFPITVSVTVAVKSVPVSQIRAAEDSGLTLGQIFRRVVLPAALPQVVVGLRIALGVSWLVMVAAEMIVVDAGLGYLIIEARNGNNSYDLVMAGMVMIGLIGWLLDLLMRQLERLQVAKAAYGIR